MLLRTIAWVSQRAFGNFARQFVNHCAESKVRSAENPKLPKILPLNLFDDTFGQGLFTVAR